MLPGREAVPRAAATCQCLRRSVELSDERGSVCGKLGEGWSVGGRDDQVRRVSGLAPFRVRCEHGQECAAWGTEDVGGTSALCQQLCLGC